MSACVSENLKARVAHLIRPSPYFEAYVRSDEWKPRSRTHTPTIEETGSNTTIANSEAIQLNYK
jgi:hypothetical protein